MDEINLYKSISLEIIDDLENNNLDRLEDLLKKRQYILDNIKDKKKLMDNPMKSQILDIDNKIKTLLSIEVEKIKHEINEHKRLIVVNNSYLKNNQEKLNIFNKKV